ncbi:CHAD domain-containing protein [Nocardia sp. SSK8]|uniref:CHAD domain-containing protein n=1 Tax=Nocardia sp. SSK8 TaxID=3120154 RepID=UPI003FA53EE9
MTGPRSRSPTGASALVSIRTRSTVGTRAPGDRRKSAVTVAQVASGLVQARCGRTSVGDLPNHRPSRPGRWPSRRQRRSADYWRTTCTRSGKRSWTGRSLPATMIRNAVDAAMHDLRKSVRRTRYYLESVRASDPSRSDQAAAGLAALQDLLGEHQDAAVAKHHLIQLTREAENAGESTFTYGLLVHREIDCASPPPAPPQGRTRRAARVQRFQRTGPSRVRMGSRPPLGRSRPGRIARRVRRTLSRCETPTIVVRA